MIVQYECSQTLEQYAKMGKENEFPVVEQCPNCRGAVMMRRHGYYWRYAIERGVEYRIPICRLKCPSCAQTVSLLPSFLLPYFQHTLRQVVVDLHSGLTRLVYQYRQRIQFYKQRYSRQLKQVEMFFRAEGFRERLPGRLKEKAIKLLEMIRAFGEATFVRRSRGHFKTNFMAL